MGKWKGPDRRQGDGLGVALGNRVRMSDREQCEACGYPFGKKRR
jgi:hypothetical protein